MDFISSSLSSQNLLNDADVQTTAICMAAPALHTLLSAPQGGCSSALPVALTSCRCVNSATPDTCHAVCSFISLTQEPFQTPLQGVRVSRQRYPHA